MPHFAPSGAADKNCAGAGEMSHFQEAVATASPQVVAVSRFAPPERGTGGFEALLGALEHLGVFIDGRNSADGVEAREEGAVGEKEAGRGGPGSMNAEPPTPDRSSPGISAPAASRAARLEASLWASPLSPDDADRLASIAARLCANADAALPHQPSPDAALAPPSPRRPPPQPLPTADRTQASALSPFVERAGVAFGSALRLSEAAARPAEEICVQSVGLASGPLAPSAHVLVFDLFQRPERRSRKASRGDAAPTAEPQRPSWCALDATEAGGEPTVAVFGMGRDESGAGSTPLGPPVASLETALAAALVRVRAAEAAGGARASPHAARLPPRQRLLDRTLASCAPVLLPWGAVLLRQSVAVLREKRRVGSARRRLGTGG